MPSQPIAQACLKMIAPSPLKCRLKATPWRTRRAAPCGVRAAAGAGHRRLARSGRSGAIVLPVTDQIENQEAVRIDHDGLAVSTNERTPRLSAAAILGNRAGALSG